MPLTFVPTPIGNLRDITLRALDELRDCDLVVAEDTRVARKLLAALALPSKPARSYREQNARSVTADILAYAAGHRVAVVSDAGTPAISDPGSALIAAARAAGIGVEVLPGACAFVTAAVLSGFALERLAFAGFVPRRAGERDQALGRALAGPETTVFYEAPSRIVATLEALDRLDSQATTFVVRELTKKFEEQLPGTPHEILAALARPVRGEIALVLAPRAPGARRPSETDAPPDSLDRAIDAALRAGASPAQAAKALAKEGFGERAALYRRIVARVQRAAPSADAP